MLQKEKPCCLPEYKSYLILSCLFLARLFSFDDFMGSPRACERERGQAGVTGYMTWCMQGHGEHVMI
jgi:hypothetical protein